MYKRKFFWKDENVSSQIICPIKLNPNKCSIAFIVRSALFSPSFVIHIIRSEPTRIRNKNQVLPFPLIHLHHLHSY